MAKDTTKEPHYEFFVQIYLKNINALLFSYKKKTQRILMIFQRDESCFVIYEMFRFLKNSDY